MSPPKSPRRLPVAAVREFENASQADWQGGVPLTELLERVNRVAESFLPPRGGSGSGAGRVKRTFTERSFRHYQTLRCIDVPEKKGRQACYGPRHLAQALLVRKLLWERVPAEQIAVLMAGRSSGEIELMFLRGVEVVLRGQEGERGGDSSIPSGSADTWRRVQVLSGVELHVREDRPRLEPEELRKVMESLEAALRKQRR